MNSFRKIHQFFMSDFLHSKYAKRRRICGMSRAAHAFSGFFCPDRTGTFSGSKFLGFQTLTRSVGKLEKVETLTRFENKLKKKITLTICENFHKFRLLTIPAHFIEL